MSNEYIELVKKWSAGEEVSGEQLRANADAAWKVYVDAEAAATNAVAANASAAARAAHAAAEATSAAAYAASAASAAYDAADDATGGDAYGADYWVKRYEELTNEQ